MFERKIPEISQFKYLAEIMEKTPHREVPEDFTAEIMAGISEQTQVKHSSAGKNLTAFGFTLGFPGFVTRTECSFYFFMTGFFYFILGVILLTGFWMAGDFNPRGWLALQPFFSILLGVILSLTGTLISKNGESAMPFVRAGILLYIVFVILNGWIGALTLKIPSAMFLMMIFSAAGLSMAFLLGLAMNRYRQENTFSEVHG